MSNIVCKRTIHSHRMPFLHLATYSGILEALAVTLRNIIDSFNGKKLKAVSWTF